MRELPTNVLARKLIRIATGEEYGDGMTVTDIADSYTEPGYRLSEDDGIVVFGNWNNHTVYDPETRTHVDRTGTKADTLPERLGNLLDSIGADIEWCDEWTTCVECYGALRTHGDSYSWKLSGVWCDGEGYACTTCALKDLASYLADYIDNPNNALTWADGTDLEAIGFVQWEADDAHVYENGWHEGMNDDPKAIFAAIKETDGGSSVVFVISEVSQFYIRFTAYTRDSNYSQEEEE